MKKQVNAAKLAAFAGAAAVGGFIYLVAPGKIRKKQKSPFQNRNFAHRGLHKRDKSVPENSLAAFERAASYGYGIELDVQLSKDGQVVVFHDDTLNRVCGVDARVDSKTLAELQQLSLCGTDETIPLFSDVLKTVRGRGALIVELKNGKNNKELCEKPMRFFAATPATIASKASTPLSCVGLKSTRPRSCAASWQIHRRTITAR